MTSWGRGGNKDNAWHSGNREHIRGIGIKRWDEQKETPSKSEGGEGTLTHVRRRNKRV